MVRYFLSMRLIVRATNCVETNALKHQDVTTLVFGKTRKTFVAGYGTHVIRVADPSLGIMFTNSLQVYQTLFYYHYCYNLNI